MADDPLRWGKFLGGFIPGKNTLKAIVQIFHIIIVLALVFSIYFTIKNIFVKKVIPTQSVGTNQGIVATSNEDKSGNTYSLFNLLNWK